jgi:chromosome segregation ATPase
MIQLPALSTSESTLDPWSSWAKVVDVPVPPDEPAPDPEPVPDLAAAVAGLADELADERALRVSAEEGRRDAEARVHAAEAEGARLKAELAGGKARIAELERDRDEVIRRAEELLTAVRERADQRLVEERQRADELARRAQDAWLAAAVLRRARPLRPRSSTPTTITAAEDEALEDLEENETDPALAAELPELAGEIEQLRQRLRNRLHKPADITTVEDSVEDLRVARLARETDAGGRRKK